MFSKLFLLASVLSVALAAPIAEASADTSLAPGLAKRNTGDVTYYTPGLGSCGITSTSSQHIVALSVAVMANGANPNANPKCKKMINIQYKGKTFPAEIVDTCQACQGDSIDVSPSLFEAIDGSLTAGRLHDVTWTYA